MTEDTTYFKHAESWALDSRAQNARSRRIAWIIAAVAVAVALFEAVALMALTPLKTVQPVTLLVDRQTGFVQALDPATPRRVKGDAALTQSFLAQYVIAREGFDRAVAQVDYRKVALWSADRARSVYLATMPATNPASPFRRYPGGTIIVARVKSVSRLSDSTALVRFDTQRSDRNGRVDAAQPWISVVRYRYVDAPMQLEDRLVNPLGFQVTSYRRDAEAPLPADAHTSATLSSTSASTPITVVERAVPAAIEPRTARVRLTRDAQRPVRVAQVASPPARPIALQPDRREVLINNLPLGSPLGPTSQVQVAAEARP